MIMEKYGQFDGEIRDDCFYALTNVLNMGDEQRLKNKLEVNPYVVKLRYESAWDVFRKYEEFEALLSKYQIEG